MDNIGFILKKLRHLYGKSSKDFSKILGISPSYLSEIENNKKTPGLNILQKYSDILDIKISTILLIAEDPEKLKNEKFYKRIIQPIMKNIILKG